MDFPRDLNKDNYLRASDEDWKMMLKNSPLSRRTNKEIVNTLKSLAEQSGKEKKRDKSQGRKGSDKGNMSEDEDFNHHTFSQTNPIFAKFYHNKSVEFHSYNYKNKGMNSDDYTWKIQGFAQLSEYSSQLAKDMNEKYEYITKMTLESFGEEKEIQTEPFRQSIMYYLELIHGYEHPEFEYKQINTLLPKEFKAAIKTMCCLPQNLHFGVLNKIPIDFKVYELIHIGLLVMETKFQIELMYGLLPLEVS